MSKNKKHKSSCNSNKRIINPQVHFSKLPYKNIQLKSDTLVNTTSNSIITPRYHIDINDKQRKKLQLYVNMKRSVEFNVTYAYKSITNDGRHVMCVRNIKDPITHEVICQHAWIKITPEMDKTLNMIPKESPIVLDAKVINYFDKYGIEKLGLRTHRIKLIPRYHKHN